MDILLELGIGVFCVVLGKILDLFISWHHLQRSDRAGKPPKDGSQGSSGSYTG
jgi:uncharacterized membrane protein